MRALTSVRVTLQKSNFDKDLERIKESLFLGLSIRKTSKLMGYTNYNGLATYLRKRRWMNLMQRGMIGLDFIKPGVVPKTPICHYFFISTSYVSTIPPFCSTSRLLVSDSPIAPEKLAPWHRRVVSLLIA